MEVYVALIAVCVSVLNWWFPLRFIQSAAEIRKEAVLEFKKQFKRAKREANGPEHRCAWIGHDRSGLPALCTNPAAVLLYSGQHTQYCG
jgi:hypothetical protein